MSISEKCSLGILVLALVACIGCGGNPATVTGEVILDGEHIIGNEDMRAQVVYHPTSGLGTPASSLIKPNGRYELSTGSKRGLQPGEYKVTIRLGKISWPNGKSQMPAITELAPKHYHRTTTTDLVVNVEPGSNRFDFELESK
ncbi:MAG: hypothetical protein MI725_12745 [Pirellulales bacterium]|nr:hypothetical protein [Pirellulales bacterium]